MLDYGAGKQTLKKGLLMMDLKMNIFCYDPSIPEISKSPGRHDLVTCTDVFEHIEPDLVDNVLDDLKRVTRRNGFFVVSTIKAIQILPDGRNAHLTIKPADWWLPKIMERFTLIEFQNHGSEFHVIVGTK